MFKGCTHLTGCPIYIRIRDNTINQNKQGELSANGQWTNLTNKTGAFESMFEGCTSLTNANNKIKIEVNYMVNGSVVRRATPVAGNEYAYMFKDCTHLATAPGVTAHFFGFPSTTHSTIW